MVVRSILAAPGANLAALGARLAPTALHALLACVGLSACAAIQPDFGVEIDYASKYVARGALLLDDPAIQPSAYATIEQGEGTWSVGVWSTLDTTDLNGMEGEVTEVDAYVEYERALGAFTATLGLLRYAYPHTGFASTGEAHAALAYDCEVATPTLHLWYDHVEADGLYASLELARSFDFDERWSFALSASTGWMAHGQGNYYFGVDLDGFSDLTTTAALSFASSETLGLTLTLGSARVLDGDYRAAASDPDTSWVILGAQLGF